MRIPAWLLLAGLALPGLGFGAVAETVSGRLAAANGVAWTYAYDAELRDDRVWVRLGIQLIPAKDVTVPELARVKPGWEAAIEAAWSGRFALESPAGQLYPIWVDVDLRGPTFHHTVVVRPGRGRTDQLDWHLLDGPELVAHEAGHALGAFDEYPGGSLATADGVIDPASLMTSDPGPGCTPRARHYEKVRAWAEGSAGAQGWSVVPWVGSAAQDTERVARQ
ncbi:MAG: hypothetical protein P1P84_13950 [Deferrisomatales bacterium]|nr:hypothetical protein [Deferrisomatales bacterium]